MSARLAPTVVDPGTRGFFQAAAEGRLAVSTCGDCGGHTHLPRPYCVHCGGDTLTWRDVPRRGRVRSWTVVEHQVHPWFPTPYTVVVIDIEDCPDVRMIGYLPGRAEVDQNTWLVAGFEDLGPDPQGNPTVLPRWTPEEHR
ncbi:Zn-ribbon domain-containing OB-fold protein [Nocardia brevicatena]|uniref:Zn-ribbon domain-containing OB-fold protein n=1 Tax=Nocardia brevicatena TaxID=37327 RepID=UPI0002E13529|nr:zinc ribbon domain-containing protein [Nocardia brevicatena]